MADEESFPAAVRSTTLHRSATGLGKSVSARFGLHRFSHATLVVRIVMLMMHKHHEPLLLLRFMKVQFVCLTCYKTVANPSVDDFPTLHP